ncbi:MAG: hypothetical protein P4L84_07270 [Isosphaeraceae bacterium]|nr:hypothetical protein [Isosphaeraceae bacterium]
MARVTRGWLGGALAWLAFPVVPAVLSSFYHDAVNLSFDGHGGPDPFEWDWSKWLTLLGPLLGFGFLAGATLDLPDDPETRGWRNWSARRAVWVAVGPWAGLLAWGTLVLLVMLVNMTFPQLAEMPILAQWSAAVSAPVRTVVWVIVAIFLVATLCYAWLLPAVAVVRRARRCGRLGPVLQRGLAVMIAFVGSLLGTFWAVTQAMRSYFFDKTAVPILVASLSLAALTGCGSTVTYGEVRRRDLFQGLLVSWVLGLAILWRWWSRPRPKA